MKIEIAGVQDVDRVWPLVGPKFHSAAQRFHEELSAGELWQMVRSGNAFLIVAYDEKVHGAVAVRFERLPSGCVLRVLALAGENLELWKDGMAQFVNDMGKANGATRIAAEGREGMSLMFKGARKLRSSYTMEIV